MRLAEIDAPELERPPNYAQAIEVAEAERWLFVSGQIPVDGAGDVPEGFEAQARLVWDNIAKQLDAAGMTFDNLVKVTIYLSDRDDREQSRAVRDTVLGGRRVALTCIIADIFDGEWLLEIEAVAAA